MGIFTSPLGVSGTAGGACEGTTGHQAGSCGRKRPWFRLKRERLSFGWAERTGALPARRRQVESRGPKGVPRTLPGVLERNGGHQGAHPAGTAFQHMPQRQRQTHTGLHRRVAADVVALETEVVAQEALAFILLRGDGVSRRPLAAAKWALNRESARSVRSREQSLSPRVRGEP